MLEKRRVDEQFITVSAIGAIAIYTTRLCKVGDAVMVAVPPELLDVLALDAGAEVDVVVEKKRLVIEPHLRPRYTLAELLAASDYSQPQTAEEREWIDAPAAGRELL